MKSLVARGFRVIFSYVTFRIKLRKTVYSLKASEFILVADLALYFSHKVAVQLFYVC